MNKKTIVRGHVLVLQVDSVCDGFMRSWMSGRAQHVVHLHGRLNMNLKDWYSCFYFLFFSNF